MKINKPYTDEAYADLAVYCNENGMIIADKGDYLESVEPAPYIPTRKEVSETRRSAYIMEVDPLTAHISRLQDGEQTDSVVSEIESLKIERDAKVAEIKERYPYPESENESEVADV